MGEDRAKNKDMWVNKDEESKAGDKCMKTLV